jgi:GNAT superfamily N-acetyltransferase
VDLDKEMAVVYRNATVDDIDFLVSSRLDFIEISVSNSEYVFIKNSIREYFIKALSEKQCDVILAEKENIIIGTGIVFYYDSVPSMFNTSGKNAYITSMYVDDKLRRQGIGTAILNKLINIAKAKKYRIFILQESDMGKPLYEKHGFIEGKRGMLLKLEDTN